MKFIIATNNKKKLVEMERILKPLGIEAVSAKDAGVVLDEVDEGREAYLKKYSDRSRYDTRNYDVVLSMDHMTEDDAVAVIMEYVGRQK